MSPDFHENWLSGMSIRLFTEVKQQWAMSVLVHFSVLLLSLMALQLTLIDRNIFGLVVFSVLVKEIGLVTTKVAEMNISLGSAG